MTRELQKHAILACLRARPDFSGLRTVAGSPPEELRKLLRWIDESGLAIYFLRQISAHDRFRDLNPWFRSELSEREKANRRRTRLMLAEFMRINEVLRSACADYAVVKGFSLAGEFCSEPWLRHQCDTDLLVTPQSVPTVTSALISLGYKVESVEPSGEVCLAIRSAHVPSQDDYLYSEPPHWHVEIHTSFYEPAWGVSLGIAKEWTGHIEWREIEGIRYPGLERAHRFLGQVLHAFRHISAWVRLSWLYEISCFAETFRNDSTLWEQIGHITDGDVKSRNACGVVCSMVQNTLGTQFHQAVQEKWIDSLTVRQQTWVQRCAPQMLLNDFTSGDKVGLLLQRGFADSRWTWWRSRLSRYLRFLRSTGGVRKTGPLFIIERARRHVNYLWRCFLWNLEAKNAGPGSDHE